MAVRKLRPMTPGQRHKVVNTFDGISTSTPEKSLLAPMKRSGGRNNSGRMTMRYIGGGHKKRYRIIDFKRKSIATTARVATIEYDPNRNARIALLHYENGLKRYILAPRSLKVGMEVCSGPEAPIEIGNSLPLAAIPLGSTVHNIELTLGKGGQIARSAGT